MKIINNDKFGQLNELGEISVKKKSQNLKQSTPWQARFLKAMIVFLLITLTILAFINQ